MDLLKAGQRASEARRTRMIRLYRLQDDWITHLEGDGRNGLLTTLRGLGLERIGKFPPPKTDGLPIGNETRVLRRYMAGRSSQLDASALSSLYRSFSSPREGLLYRAFRQNAPMTRAEWSDIIGGENVPRWVEDRFLQEMEDDLLACSFSVISLDGLICAVDSLNDHGEPSVSVALAEVNEDIADDPDIRPFHHTYIGQDTLRMIEAMAGQEPRRGGRFLECGCGAGAILLSFAGSFDESVGIDINPRSVKLARFNAELNGLANCRTLEANALALPDNLGRFDMVAWNLPFIFLPDEWKDLAIDGYGGEMGIGLCLDFIEALPGYLTDDGVAYVAALAPILDDGTNVLEDRLSQRLARLGLDCTVLVSQISLAHNREQWLFHRSFDISKFESVYLCLRRGSGGLRRIEAPLSRRMLDSLRVSMYKMKFA